MKGERETIVETELTLFPIDKKLKRDVSSTFANNMSLPVHKWYRYTAGFSASWVSEVIKRERLEGRTRIIDPFAGSGTVLIQSEVEGVDSIGIEAQPYVYRIAKAKLQWLYNASSFKSAALHLLDVARKKMVSKMEFPKLIESCFPPEILTKLEALRLTWLEIDQKPEIKDFTWFIITAILRVSSPVGTAQWQYIQPNKTKSKVVDPFVAYENKVLEMYLDMVKMQKDFTQAIPALIYNEDSRNIKSIPDGWGDLVITSPPYANNYDYADATRLEMSFWGDISGWKDLQENVRGGLIRACTQHVSNLKSEIDGILSSL